MTNLKLRSRRNCIAGTIVLLGALLALSVSAVGQPATQKAQPYFTEPAISPDGSEIAFVSGGDIWTVPATGGEARLLVSHPANESRPLYSPDGHRLAFISTRTGNGDIYVLTLDTGDLKRLTSDDSNDQLDAWSADGRWLYFTSSSKDIAGMNNIFRIAVDGRMTTASVRKASQCCFERRSSVIEAKSRSP